MGGRRSYAESKPETVALAKELHGQRLSLSKFAAELAARGHLTASGRPYVASAVHEMSGRAAHFQRTSGHLRGNAGQFVLGRPTFLGAAAGRNPTTLCPMWRETKIAALNVLKKICNCGTRNEE